MFEKSKRPHGSEALADRVRRVGERKPQATVDQPAPKKLQKRVERAPAYRQATVHCAGGQKLIVAIKNLNVRGARIETRERLVLSDEVVLTEATLGLKRRARVVWQHEGAAGLAFIEP